MANPYILQGKSYGQARSILSKSEGWINSVMRKTRGTDKGWVLREINNRGQETGRQIQFHPGSRRHFNGNAYWKIIDGVNEAVRFPVSN